MTASIPSSLEETISAGTPAPPSQSFIELAAGDLIGRYVVLDRIGAGGMGVVYAAYDPELDRKIALKLLRSWAVPGRRAQSRMQREAQALAKLAHPNVLMIYDVGTHGDRLWLALEHVEGETLAQWLARTPRSWREVVTVMAAAGRGLAAAHATGLVHRDVKPDNIMVGSDGRVRVMDFGLARASAHEDELEESSAGTSTSPEATEVGALVGTPAYMAPEQFHGAKASAASDQFSFCVAFYEALYGVRPFPGENVAEIAAAVLDGAVAPPPATARPVPRWLRELVVHGLARPATDRFRSMDALLDALARGQGRARRRWVLVSLAGMLAVAGGAVAAKLAIDRDAQRTCDAEGQTIAEVWPGRDEERRTAMQTAMLATDLPFAQTALEHTTPWLDRHAQAWAELRTSVCARAAIERTLAPEPAKRARACLDQRRDELESIVEVLVAADAVTVQQATAAAASLDPIEACGDFPMLERSGGLGEPGSRVAERELQRRLLLAAALRETGRRSEALARIDELVTQAESLGSRSLLAEALRQQAKAAAMLGDIVKAERAAERAFSIALGEGHDLLALEAVINLVLIVGYHGARPTDGLRWAEIARALIHRTGVQATRLEGFYLHDLAIVQATAGDAEALATMERALELIERELGSEHPGTAGVIEDLGAMLFMRGELRRSLGFHERALAIKEAVLGPTHPALVHTLSNLGATYGELGEPDRAIAYLERALAVAEGGFGHNHIEVATALENLGVALRRRGDGEAGLPKLQRALQIREASLPADHPYVLRSLTVLGGLEIELERWTDALPHCERALALHERSPQPSSDQTITLLSTVGEALVGLHRANEAIPLLERALTVDEAADADILAAPRFMLARALVETGGDRARALELARTAAEAFNGQGPDGSELAALVSRWITEHYPDP